MRMIFTARRIRQLLCGAALSLIALSALVFIPAESRGLFIANEDYKNLRNNIAKKYAGMKPTAFSSKLPGIKKRIKTQEKILAFTFDACGKKGSAGYDKRLISYLNDEQIPATLFISGKWINYNYETFRELGKNPLFEIANHGMLHRPCTVSGYMKYRIPGTKNAGEVVDEIELNARKIETIIGIRPVFYRSGTAFYDDIALRIAYDLKHIPLNYSVIAGDFNYRQPAINIALHITGQAIAGGIVIMHMNHPEGNSCEGLRIAVPRLRAMGYRFVQLGDYISLLE